MEILVCTFRKTVGCTFMEIDISALLDLAATGCRGYADGIRWWIARRNTRYTRCCWCCNLSDIQSWYWQQLWTIGQGHKKSLIRGWLLPNRLQQNSTKSSRPNFRGAFRLWTCEGFFSRFLKFRKYFQPLSATFSQLMQSVSWPSVP